MPNYEINKLTIASVIPFSLTASYFNRTFGGHLLLGESLINRLSNDLTSMDEKSQAIVLINESD